MKQTWVAWSLDWSVQPFALEEYRNLMRARAKMGFNLAVSFAGPGPGKKIWTPNGSGAPYSNNYKLEWNMPFWREIDERVKIANDLGITLVFSYSFADQGIFSSKVIDQSKLLPDILRIGERYKGASAIWSPVSEAEEGGSKGIARTKEIVAALREVVGPDPVGFHSVNDNSNRDWVDFISVQTRNRFDAGRYQKMRKEHPDKPILICEDQKANDGDAINRMRLAHQLDCTYTLTNRNWNISDWLSGQVEEYARSVK